jgi:6-phosphogluconolactonase
VSTVALELVGAPSALADRAAGLVADHLRGAVAERGTATVAFSGGHTPAAMLSALTAHDLPWRHIHVFQVDERVVANSHLERNLGMLRSRLLAHVPVPASHVHPMPVADADLEAAASRYAAVLARVCGEPAVLDLVHLGLGGDGHTASLVPNDPVLAVGDRDVAPTGLYQGTRRLTLTYPAINRARHRLWLVSGRDKAEALGRLTRADPAIPAAGVSQDDTTVLTDVNPAGSGG